MTEPSPGPSMGPSDEAALAADLRRAAELFDAAEYHAAHEVLDELWERSSARDSDFLKGLIQACIALHHYAAGNPDGARKLYSGHRRYLADYLPSHRGVDVARLLADMQAFLAPLLRSRPGSEPPFDAAARPRLVLDRATSP